MIYNEYYRDQNLTKPIEFSLNSGIVLSADEVTRLLTLRRRAWEKDYFTSALPWVQRGPEVTVPIQGSGGNLDVTLKMMLMLTRIVCPEPLIAPLVRCSLSVVRL